MQGNNRKCTLHNTQAHNGNGIGVTETTKLLTLFNYKTLIMINSLYISWNEDVLCTRTQSNCQPIAVTTKGLLTSNFNNPNKLDQSNLIKNVICCKQFVYTVLHRGTEEPCQCQSCKLRWLSDYKQLHLLLKNWYILQSKSRVVSLHDSVNFK